MAANDSLASTEPLAETSGLASTEPLAETSGHASDEQLASTRVLARNTDVILRRLSLSEHIEDQLEELDIAEKFADRAREELLTGPAPTNWRERIKRAARDATINASINMLESQIEEMEDETIDFIVGLVESHEEFLKVNYEEWKEFISGQLQEWEAFLTEYGEDLRDLLADPTVPALEAFYEEGWELGEFVMARVQDSHDFSEEQIEEAMEFLKTNTESVKTFTEGHLKFLTESIESVLMLADVIGLEHEGLDMLEDFAEDPTGFIIDQAVKYMEKHAEEAEMEIKERMLEITEELLGEEAGDLVERLIEAMEGFSLEAAAEAAADAIEDVALDFTDYAEEFLGDNSEEFDEFFDGVKDTLL